MGRIIILETVSVPDGAFITRDGIRQAVQHAMQVTEEEFETLEIVEGEVLYSINQETLHTAKASDYVTTTNAPVVNNTDTTDSDKP